LMQVEVPDEGATEIGSSSRNGVVSRQLEYPVVDIGAPDLVSKQVKLSSVCSCLVVFHTSLYRYFFTYIVTDVICNLSVISDSDL
jgi:hypothetical protein